MDLIEIIKGAGIVGAGGAGFPSHVKLSAKADYIILNGAECEPLLRVDQQIIVRYVDEIIECLKKLMKLTGAKKTYIGVKAKHRDVIQLLSKKLIKYKLIELVQLSDFYPAGDEQVLVNEVTGRVVPEVNIPLKVGCIVINVETVINIYNAISGKPVTHTYITINGKVVKPITVRLPIGISYSEAVRLAGVESLKGLILIDGGPMMGKIVSDVNAPITKTTKGILVLDEDSYLIRKKMMSVEQALKQSKAACLQCRMCTELCPRYLLGHNMQPHLMMRRSNFDRNNIEAANTAVLCSECGACELFACPAGLSPKLINKHYKQKLSEKSIKYKPLKAEFEVLKIREYRKIPVKRLIARLGLANYDVPAPLEDMEYDAKRVVVPLKQHIGAPCKPAVEVGQDVNVGDLIGEILENAIGARVHASITGVIKEISNNNIIIESI